MHSEPPPFPSAHRSTRISSHEKLVASHLPSTAAAAPVGSAGEDPSEDPDWARIRTELQTLVGADSFQRWFRFARWHGCEEGVAHLSVPGEMHHVWVDTNYMPELRHAIGTVRDDMREVRLSVLNPDAPAAEDPENSGEPASQISIDPVELYGNSSMARKFQRQAGPLEGDALHKRIKSAGLNPVYTFRNFVVGQNSQFAHAACEAVSRGSGTGYNPLFIYGHSGLGKTHLMQAVGQEMLRRNPQSRVVYLTCEKFTNEFIDNVRRGDIEKFRRRYRTADVLLIDDIQFLAGKDRSQEEFFHTFNTLLDGQNQVILTSDRPACEIKSLEPRLVSRFECGLTVEMQVPQLETRIAILRTKARDWKVRVDEHILTFLAENIRLNVRRLEGALMKVATYASLAGESVTLENVTRLLHDILREEGSKQIGIDAIQRTVAEHFDIRLADMTGRRRQASVSHPRQIAMYLSRSLTRGSLMEIGEAFGGRDHGTVIHACKKITKLLADQPDLRDTISRIESHLRR